MSQQINLYNESLLPQKDALTSAMMLRAAGGFVLLLALLAGYQFQQLRKVEAERADWNTRAEEAKSTLMQLTQQFPPRQPNPLLEGEIKAVEDKIQSRDRVFDALKNGAVGKSQGFSSLLEAFGRQSLNGLWQTGISMNGAGDQMRISGNALSADLIPQYITRLSSEPALRGRNFSAFQVGQPKPIPQPAGAPAAAAPSYVEFTLSADKVAELPGNAAGKPPVEAQR